MRLAYEDSEESELGEVIVTDEETKHVIKAETTKTREWNGENHKGESGFMF